MIQWYCTHSFLIGQKTFYYNGIVLYDDYDHDYITVLESERCRTLSGEKKNDYRTNIYPDLCVQKFTEPMEKAIKMRLKEPILVRSILDITVIEYLTLKPHYLVNNKMIEWFVFTVYGTTFKTFKTSLFPICSGFSKMETSYNEGDDTKIKVKIDLKKWCGDLKILEINLIFWHINTNQCHWCLTAGAVGTMEIYAIDPYEPYDFSHMTKQYEKLIFASYYSVWDSNLQQYEIEDVWKFGDVEDSNCHPFKRLHFAKQRSNNTNHCVVLVCTYIWNIVKVVSFLSPSNVVQKLDHLKTTH